jgi:iron complex outermembrane receptor protein
MCRKWRNNRIERTGTIILFCSALSFPSLFSQADTSALDRHYRLEEVTAFGENNESLLSSSLRMTLTIDGDQIQTSPARSFDDLLDYYPQADLRTRGVHGIQSDLSIRGGSFDQSMVLLNGIDMTDPQTGHFTMDLPVSLAQARKIELLTGPSSRNHGLNAYSGAVNIATAPDDSLGAEGRIEYGQYGLIRSDFSVDLPFRSTATRIAYNSGNSKGYRENTDFSSDGLFLHSRVDHATLPFEIMAGLSDKQFGANSFYTPRFPEQYEKTATYVGAIKFRTRWSGPAISGQVYFRSHSDHFMLFRDQPALYENHHKTRVAGSRVTGTLSTIAGITQFVIAYRHEGIISTTLGDALEVPVSVPGSDTVFFSHAFSRNRASVAINHTLQKRRWMLSGGAIVQAGFERNIPAGIYPGLDLSARIGPSTRLFVSGNRSMRLPTFTDLYYEGPENRGNPNLAPETALTFESGIRHKGSALNGSLSVFYRRGRETIDWIRLDDLWQARNITELDAWGGSATLSVFPGTLYSSLDFIRSVRVAYNYTEISKASDAFISNYVLDNLKHKWILDMHLDLPAAFFADLKTIWQDRNGSFSYYETPQSDPRELEYGPFWIVDASIGIAMNRLSVQLSATNLLNTTYRDIGSVVMPGRWIVAGLYVNRHR